MKKPFALLVASIALCSSFVFADVVSLRGQQPVAEENVAPSLKPVPKNQARIALNYVNQPPMIPHSVEGYQVNPSNNSCLDCHDIDNYLKTGAVRISPTHFIDRDNKLLSKVAARRYFCQQCHVPQVQAAPIVDNDFVPTATFAHKDK